MDRDKALVVAGMGYILWTSYGLVAKLNGTPGSGETTVYYSNNRQGGSTLDSEGERSSFNGGIEFLDLHDSVGSGRDNSALTAFARTHNINMGSYKEMESSFSRLAASINPFQARQEYQQAKANGAAPEVVNHYQYLMELAEAFQQGRLPELIKRWFGTSNQLSP